MTTNGSRIENNWRVRRERVAVNHRVETKLRMDCKSTRRRSLVV